MALFVILFPSFASGQDATTLSPPQEEIQEIPPPSPIELEFGSLKNPFISQLPKPFVAEVKPPEPPPKTEIFPTVKPEIKPKPQTQIVQEVKKPPVVNPPVLSISGLVWNTDRPQAIVNGQIYELGDSVDNATIMEINENGIIVMYKGSKFNIINTKR